MGSPYLSPYEDPDAHARISALIRRHSTNDRDVRVELLRALDLGDARDVLDLGCGFGFWAEELAVRVASGAWFTGVDACVGNEAAYVRCVEARVLRPGGTFLAVTHSDGSFARLLEAVGLADEESPLLRRLQAFSSERGGELLAGTFGRVERRDYLNTLTFVEKDLGDLLAYLAFKLPLVKPGARYGVELPDALIQAASVAMRRIGTIVTEKDDTLFACGDPHGR
ncbi:MAG: hypothetical protein FIA95_17215 [Gemmatimonadetes bacterium]|nr:hypothetical protein [Gemmatimonadota bacterium]